MRFFHVASIDSKRSGLDSENAETETEVKALGLLLRACDRKGDAAKNGKLPRAFQYRRQNRSTQAFAAMLQSHVDSSDPPLVPFLRLLQAVEPRHAYKRALFETNVPLHGQELRRLRRVGRLACAQTISDARFAVLLCH